MVVCSPGLPALTTFEVVSGDEAARIVAAARAELAALKLEAAAAERAADAAERAAMANSSLLVADGGAAFVQALTDDVLVVRRTAFDRDVARTRVEAVQRVLDAKAAPEGPQVVNLPTGAAAAPPPIATTAVEEEDEGAEELRPAATFLSQLFRVAVLPLITAVVVIVVLLLLLG